MKKLMMIPFIGILISCDPFYSVHIANRSQNDIYVETDKKLEVSNFFKNTPDYDSIASKNLSTTGKGLYLLKHQENIRLFSHIGYAPTDGYFPFENVKIIKGSDTIIIDKNNFQEKITNAKKTPYYINID